MCIGGLKFERGERRGGRACGIDREEVLMLVLEVEGSSISMQYILY